MPHIVAKRRNRKTGGWTFSCRCGFHAEMTKDGNYWVEEWGDLSAQAEHQQTMYTGELPLRDEEKPRRRLFGFL